MELLVGVPGVHLSVRANAYMFPRLVDCLLSPVEAEITDVLKPGLKNLVDIPVFPGYALRLRMRSQ
jgi:hypothetical protein